MKNGYFQLEAADGSVKLHIFPPEADGEKVNVNEVADYLNSRGYVYDLPALNRVIESGEASFVPVAGSVNSMERESYRLMIQEDNMLVTVRFYAPSVNGELMTFEEFKKDLNFRYISYGINEEALHAFFDGGKREYCTNIVVARGLAPRHGEDARIEYYFNTDLSMKPAQNDDGSVDFFHLNTVCPCTAGQVLARIIPADEGEYGYNVQGERIKPRDVKRVSLKYGRNIELSEDRLSITSLVDGHVTLVDDKVFVSNILEVENVDNSTGNIDYEGSVEIKGNVCANFEVRARGNIIVRGVVEGAVLVAGGDIIIERGVNGMGKGVLAARGNIVSKFLENVNASAGGYVSTDSILHSKVYAGTEVTVAGKKGFITGGQVCATNLISVKTLGSAMGASTIVEVGAQPEIKNKYHELQKQITEDQKTLKSIQPILEAYEQKKNDGMQIDKEKLKYILSLKQAQTQKMQEMEKNMKELDRLQSLIENKNNAQVAVSGEVFPGTKIVISEVSMVVQKSMQFCRFVKKYGDVKMISY